MQSSMSPRFSRSYIEGDMNVPLGMSEVGQVYPVEMSLVYSSSLMENTSAFPLLLGVSWSVGHLSVLQVVQPTIVVLLERSPSS